MTWFTSRGQRRKTAAPTTTLTTYLCATALVAAVAVAGARSELGARAADTHPAGCRSVCVSSGLRGPALLPGAPGDRVLITLAAAGEARTVVTSLTVSLANRFPAGCPASAFTIGGIPLSGKVPAATIMPRGPIVLGGRRGTRIVRYATTLALSDNGQNQDSCQDLRLVLRLSARAR